MAGSVGAPAHLSQQRLPFMTRQSASFEIGPRPFAPMVEEADVVVFPFERLYLALDKVIQLAEIGLDLGRNIKVQCSSPPMNLRVTLAVSFEIALLARGDRGIRVS